MTKSTVRTIKNSLGRYVAILAIIALGAAFFTGLLVTRPAMIKTLDAYVDETNFFDWRMLSTLGYDEEAVAAFAAAKGVSAAEGAIAADVLALGESGSDVVLKAHSLTHTVNIPQLKAGRLPETANECLVDWLYLGEEAIGSTIRLSANNNEDTLDMFAYEEYTIVGAALSPLYINHERGTSTLGDGTTAAFVYIPEEGFDVDYYTEVYITLEGRAGVYTAELEALTEESEEPLTALAEQEAQRRYEDILSEAYEELADGQKDYDEGYAEYLDGLAEYEEEKAEAEQDLAEAEQELVDAEAELAEGWEEFNDGVNTLVVETAKAEQELADAEAELADALVELNDGEAEYADGIKELEEAEADYAEGLAEYEDGYAQYLDGLEQYNEGSAALDEVYDELSAGEAALAAAGAELEAKQAQFDGLTGQLGTYLGGITGDALMDGLRSGDEQLKAGADAALAASGAGMNSDGLIAAEDELNAGWEQYQASKEQLADGWDAVSSGGADLMAAKKELDKVKKELEDAKQTLDEARAELDDGWAELNEARAELDEAWADYEQGLVDLEEGRAELAEEKAKGWTELGDAQKELEEAEAELADGWAEYHDGRAEADAEFADAEAELAEAEAELAEAALDLADAQKEIDDIEAPEVYVLGRGTNVGYACFENDTQIIAGIARVFPLFFFLVAALVCITTMTRMVDEERTEIGVMKAMGFSGGHIISKYLVYSGSASLIGCVIGFFVGSYLFPYIIWQAYCIMYGFTGLLFYIDIPLGLLSTLAYLAISSLTTWMACRSELKNVPAQIIRPKAPKAGKRIFLERITFLWKRVPFLHKVSIRNIIRYKQRLFMMILGIGGCTALIVTGYGVRDSVSDIVGYQFEEIALYDYTVSFTDAQTGESVDELLSPCADRLSAYQLVYQSSMDLEVDGVVKTTNVIMPAEGSLEGLVDFHQNGESVAFPGTGEAIICTNLADTLALTVGDSFLVRDSDMNALTLTVSGVFENYVDNYLYVAPETFQEQWGAMPEMKTLYANRAPGEELYDVAAALLDCDGVNAVSASQDMADRVGSMMSALDYVVWLIIACSGALAFVVLYNLTNINITERLREIATIKVLGFYPGESASYVFRENLVLTAMGALVGLPAGVALLNYVMAQVKIDAMYFPARVLPASYLWALAFTFLFAAIVNMVMYFKLERIHMAEALKSVE